MMRLPSSKLVALLLGFGVLADAHAATFTLDRDVVAVGETIVFHITTERAGMPDGWQGVWEGAEVKSGLLFSGPCSNGWSGAAPPGSSLDVSFPGGGWGPSLYYPQGCPDLSTPGSYVATLFYRRFDATPIVGSTEYRIDLPFNVVPELVELEVTPRRIPVGETVTLSANLNPDEPAHLLVSCAGGGITANVEEFTDDFAVEWPGPFFDDDCDSSSPGEYIANLVTSLQSDTERFWVYGDRDGDGLFDPDDNCPNDPNPGQEDADGDDHGDVCDPDDDGDGVSDDTDNCLDLANTSQADLDEDGAGDACDPDLDGDGIANESDNCPNVANPEQQEACVADPNDTDGDGQTNLADNCPDVFNPGQQDPDGDGIGTACDLDIDGDGLSNDDESVAGTDPLEEDILEDDDITTLWAGTVLTSTDVVEDGEIVGVVVDADPDVTNVSISIRVIDPVGSPYLLRDFLGSTPFAFAFMPVLPGEWTIEAELGNGALITAVIHVIPEPDPVAAAIAALIALGIAARRRRVSAAGEA